jgi:hypothetical protein
MIIIIRKNILQTQYQFPELQYSLFGNPLFVMNVLNGWIVFESKRFIQGRFIDLTTMVLPGYT